MKLMTKLFKNHMKPLRNKIKGKIGEQEVSRKLNPLIFGKVEHRLINNLVIKDDNGKTHQIDHIEIRHNGIFCIETKNYIGWIFGTDYSQNWVQTLYTGEKNYFYNPLKQNKSHIYHLSQKLDKKYKINSVVVMVNDNADKIVCSNGVNLSDLKRYLSSFDDGTYYTTEEMDSIYQKLIIINNPDISNKEHIDNIKKTKQDLYSGICPRCGGRLTERTGPYGKFIGCSNYPNCKFILKNKTS